MDYASLLEALSKAPLFDLWRLKTAIARTLEDPRKNEAIRASLRVGQSTHYLDAAGNREISGCIIEIKRSRALIQHYHDKKLWNVPFYMINLQGQDVDVPAKAHEKVRRDLLRVGDAVGFRDRTNREVYGVVTKLNRKTAAVRLTTGEQWRVHYDFLFHILDAQAYSTQQAPQHQIENEVPEAEEPEQLRLPEERMV